MEKSLKKEGELQERCLKAQNKELGLIKGRCFQDLKRPQHALAHIEKVLVRAWARSCRLQLSFGDDGDDGDDDGYDDGRDHGIKLMCTHDYVSYVFSHLGSNYTGWADQVDF